MPARKSTAPKPEKNKSLEQWIWDAACGSGGMFVQSEKFVLEHGGRIGDLSIYGQERELVPEI